MTNETDEALIMELEKILPPLKWKKNVLENETIELPVEIVDFVHTRERVINFFRTALQDRITREDNHPMLSNNYRVETFDFRLFGDIVHKAIIRKDSTKEQVEWVNVEILYSLIKALTPKHNNV